MQRHREDSCLAERARSRRPVQTVLELLLCIFGLHLMRISSGLMDFFKSWTKVGSISSHLRPTWGEWNRKGMPFFLILQPHLSACWFRTIKMRKRRALLWVRHFFVFQKQAKSQRNLWFVSKNWPKQPGLDQNSRWINHSYDQLMPFTNFDP